MNLKKLKLELFYIRKAFLKYKKGFKYLANKYFLTPEILKLNKILEKPINSNDLSVHVLTSHRDLIMLIWALGSFYQNTETIGQLFIHSDGSITDRDKKVIKRFFPNALIIEPKEFLEKKSFELDKYPVINKLRKEYPDFFLLKKLIDPYFASESKFHLIIDSDVLWFNRPLEIEEGIKAGKSLMMQGLVGEGEPNYVYFKDGSKLEDKLANLNSGIVLYQKENFNLEKLTEYFEKFDLSNSKNKHFIEQAGYAYCLKELTGLPPSKYQIQDLLNESTTVRHYTSPKRPLFYIEGLEFLKNKLLD